MIGPKCQTCGKGLKYHSAVHKLCPMGKRRKCPVTGEILYEDSHPTNRFQPREKSKGGASEKRKDRYERRKCKANPCCACGTKGTDWNPVDPAHLRSFKVTQSDHPMAFIPLCRDCHRCQHKEGWGYVFAWFPHVADLVVSMGWEITPDPFSPTRVILSHKEIA